MTKNMRVGVGSPDQEQIKVLDLGGDSILNPELNETGGGKISRTETENKVSQGESMC